jgi:methionyl-tRNA synthetase
MKAVFACNQYIDAQAPWALRKTDLDRMTAVLATLYQAIRDLTIAIMPVIPVSAGNLLDQMGISEEGRSFAALGDAEGYRRLASSRFKLELPKPIFPRLDVSADA